MVDGAENRPGTLIDHGTKGWLRITGPERKNWLQGITTADVMNVPSGAFWGLLLDRTGKIRHEIIGIEDSVSLRLCSLSEGLESLYRYLDSMLVMEDAELHQEPESSLWSLHGHHVDPQPASSGIEAASGEVRDRPQFRNTVVFGRLSWVTNADWVFAVSAADQSDWLASMSRIGLGPAQSSEWERLRIAAGIPAWGVDYSAQDTPHHAGLFGRAVAPNKGCYIGQEVVCKVQMRGHVSQRVACLALDSSEGIAPGLSVTLPESGETVGTLTSVAPQNAERGAFALARVKTAAFESNPELRVGTVRCRFAEVDSAVL
jgi:folate-binding protein YgfZ